MEIVQTCSKRKVLSPTKTICPCNIKYAKKYVQPPRVKSFAPERLYKAPSRRLDTDTTYHLSYLNVDHTAARHARSQPIRPVHSLKKSDGQFFDETTNKLSYRPIWQVVKPEPILPKRRPMIGQGSMESITTIRRDYVAKHIQKSEMIIPCGNIRTSAAPLDDRTMAKLSYVHPGPMEPVINFKPIAKYCPPSQPLTKDTTQKLSYQPFVVDKKEFYPWARKSVYKQPDIAMCGKTTYLESYLKNDAVSVEKPILPVTAYVFPFGEKFTDETIYKRSYLPSDAERVGPFLPRGSITISDAKLSADTTSKLSYQYVSGEKRKPFLPRGRCTLGIGAMQSETTTRCEYPAKRVSRPNLIVPCGNIRNADAPLEGDTTTGLSYVKPGPIKSVRSYKPITQYCKPEIKIDSETINKLSYQTWTPEPKEEIPWAQKGKYQLPVHPMASDTVYHTSYPAPGFYYIEDSCADSLCPTNEQNNVLSAPEKVAS